MDLKERVKDSINSLDLPLKCLPGYLDGKHDPELRLQMLPGSNVIERDYAGNKTEQYFMEVIMRGSDEELINQVLWQIANVLGDNDFRVISKDGSFVFSTLEIASFPHPTMADTTGTVTYAFDFKITVNTFEK
ncbi:minor capsid protein [Limosilactobacillus reuteri]|uniref:Minor capsid protein n=1 Tax=Limosilactobacillus reuteri TaxID=1598 RepID=A0A317GI05_LIMRT|nr:minor capsid protein [Limosilactobacillus reuteri]MCH5385321.1 minor capsid protein [Limosilactobacillus reuteri]PWT47925.1 minor capsid protein [Limosilactobacillus reuteri]PWT52269.1 minor capsid protein [Limosilactobacillus reuteri]PWT63036.1 minor capsid protein [Limosilactobacillus reuteri]